MVYDIFTDNDENFRINTTYPDKVKKGSIILLPNRNCEFRYDSVLGVFYTPLPAELMFDFVIKGEIIDTDLSDYVPEKSNNGGKYGFATVKVLEILEFGVEAFG